MRKLKNITTFLLIVSTLMAVIVFNTYSTIGQTIQKPGDINNDGKITASDARLALRASADLITLTEEEFTAADVDGNENVTESDARQILRFSARLITAFKPAQQNDIDIPDHSVDSVVYPGAIDRAAEAIRISLGLLRQSPRDDLSRVSFPYEYPKKSISIVDMSVQEKEAYDDLYAHVLNFYQPGSKSIKYKNSEDIIVSEEKIQMYQNILYNKIKVKDRDYREFAYYLSVEDGVKVGNGLLKFNITYRNPWNGEIINPKLPGYEAELSKSLNELKALEAVADLIVRNIPQDASTYDKYRYLAYVISCLTDYNHERSAGTSVENFIVTISPYNALIGDGVDCGGYATTMEYLCYKADLWCLWVGGSATGGSHAWNMVKLVDGTYHVDVTWSDSALINDDSWLCHFMLTEEDNKLMGKTLDSFFVAATGKTEFHQF